MYLTGISFSQCKDGDLVHRLSGAQVVISFLGNIFLETPVHGCCADASIDQSELNGNIRGKYVYITKNALVSLGITLSQWKCNHRRNLASSLSSPWQCIHSSFVSSNHWRYLPACMECRFIKSRFSAFFLSSFVFWIPFTEISSHLHLQSWPKLLGRSALPPSPPSSMLRYRAFCPVRRPNIVRGEGAALYRLPIWIVVSENDRLNL